MRIGCTIRECELYGGLCEDVRECGNAYPKPWPGYCQSCGAVLVPRDATSCKTCGADDIDD